MLACTAFSPTRVQIGRNESHATGSNSIVQPFGGEWPGYILVKAQGPRRGGVARAAAWVVCGKRAKQERQTREAGGAVEKAVAWPQVQVLLERIETNNRTRRTQLEAANEACTASVEEVQEHIQLTLIFYPTPDMIPYSQKSSLQSCTNHLIVHASPRTIFHTAADNTHQYDFTHANIHKFCSILIQEYTRTERERYGIMAWQYSLA